MFYKKPVRFIQLLSIPVIAALLMAALGMTVLAQAPTQPSRLGISAPREVFGNGKGQGFYKIQIYNEGTEPATSVLRLAHADYTNGLATSLSNCSTTDLVTTCPINRLTGVMTVAVTVTLQFFTDGGVDQCIYADDCLRTSIRYVPWYIFLPAVEK